MSRAFVKEDAGDDLPPGRYGLPSPDDPSYDAAAALALIEAAVAGDRYDAERATGYRWGEPHLRPHVRRLIEKEEALPVEQRNERFTTMARRFLDAS